MFSINPSKTKLNQTFSDTICLYYLNIRNLAKKQSYPKNKVPFKSIQWFGRRRLYLFSLQEKATLIHLKSALIHIYFIIHNR